MQQTQKAFFQKMAPNGETPRGAPLPVMFNPTDFTLTKGAQLAEINVPGLAAPLQQFVRGVAAKLTVRLLFDSTDQGMGVFARGVTEKTDKFFDLVKIEGAKHAPPICRFVWGSKFPGADLKEKGQRDPHFVGVIESIQQEFSLFSPKGIPLRAVLTVTMREFKTLKLQRDQLYLASPDRTHARVVQRGDTLASIAAEVYGSPARWRPLAVHNRIRDPRRLLTGTVLEVPPLDQGVVV